MQAAKPSSNLDEKKQRPKTTLGLPIFTLATDHAPESCVVIVVMRSLRF